MPTGSSLLGQHPLDVLGILTDPEVATFGNCNLNAYVRFYDSNETNRGYIFGLSNSTMCVVKENAGSSNTLFACGGIGSSNTRVTSWGNNASFDIRTSSGIVHRIGTLGSIFNRPETNSNLCIAGGFQSNVYSAVTDHVFMQNTTDIARFTLTGSEGRLGIGKVPSQAIDVSGNAVISGSVTATTISISNITSPTSVVNMSANTLSNISRVSAERNTAGVLASFSDVRPTPPIALMSVHTDYVSVMTKLGVGTNTPRSNLDIVGNINFTGTMTSNGSRYPLPSWDYYTPSDVAMFGNVGIGTTNIQARLHVNDDTMLIGSNIWSYGGSNMTKASGRINNVNITSLNARSMTSETKVLRTFERTPFNTGHLSLSHVWIPAVSTYFMLPNSGQTLKKTTDFITYTNIPITGSPNNYRLLSACWFNKTKLFYTVGQVDSPLSSIFTWFDASAVVISELFIMSTGLSSSSMIFNGITAIDELGLLIINLRDVAVSGAHVTTSPDGIFWTSSSFTSLLIPYAYLNTPLETTQVLWVEDHARMYAIGRAINNPFTSFIVSSSNGSAWQFVSASATVAYGDVTWSPDVARFVAIRVSSAVAEICYSTDLRTWHVASPTITSSASLTWCREYSLFAVTIRTAVFVSRTGIVWQQLNASLGGPSRLLWIDDIQSFVYNDTVTGVKICPPVFGPFSHPAQIVTTPSSVTVNSGLSINCNPSSSYALDISGNVNFTGTLNQNGNPFVSGFSEVTNTYALINKNVGIGISSDPLVRLYVSGTMRVNSGALGINMTPLTTSLLDVANTSGTRLVQIDTSGNIITSGDITAFSTFAVSDKRMKTNIVSIPQTQCVQTIMDIKPVSFTWNSNTNMYGTKSLGVIAQDLEAVLPEAVSTKYALNGNEMKTVNYDTIIPLLVGALQQVVQRLDKLESIHSQ